MTRRQKKVVSSAVLMPCLVVLVAVPVTLHGLSRQDARHARFYNTGKTINGFLSSYCKALEEAHASGDAATLAALYGDDYRAPGRGRWEWSADGLAGEVEVWQRRAAGRADYGRVELAAELRADLAEVAAIERTVCKIDLIEELELERSARLTVKLIVDGVDPRDRFYQDRLFYRWHLIRDPGPEPAWKIVRDELVEGVRVAGRRTSFTAVDPRLAGIDFEHRRDPKLDMKKYRSKLEFGVIQHASGGLSAADYNLDGRPDLLFLDGRRCRLYRNEGASPDGSLRFADVTAEAGLEGIDQAHVGLFADFDNDGDRDLFVGRYLAPSKFFRNAGGRFADVSSEVGLDVSAPVTSAALLDFDRDGFLDLYLGANADAFEAFPRLPFFAQNGVPNRLFHNRGGGRFVDVTAASGTGDVGWSLAVAAGDVNGDGWPDLAVANDFGRKNLYLNRGAGAASGGSAGTFAEIAKQAGVLDFSGGMGLAFGDFDDDGRVDLYTSNINSNQRWFGEDMTVSQYVRNVLRTRWMLADLAEYWRLYRLVGGDWKELGYQIGEGNSLFRNATGTAPAEVRFDELKDSHADRAGWGWGVAFFDMDNDADLDLYAANGWISNTPDTDL